VPHGVKPGRSHHADKSAERIYRYVICYNSATAYCVCSGYSQACQLHSLERHVIQRLPSIPHHRDRIRSAVHNHSFTTEPAKWFALPLRKRGCVLVSDLYRRSLLELSFHDYRPIKLALIKNRTWQSVKSLSILSGRSSARRSSRKYLAYILAMRYALTPPPPCQPAACAGSCRATPQCGRGCRSYRP